MNEMNGDAPTSASWVVMVTVCARLAAAAGGAPHISRGSVPGQLPEGPASRRTPAVAVAAPIFSR